MSSKPRYAPGPRRTTDLYERLRIKRAMWEDAKQRLAAALKELGQALNEVRRLANGNEN